MDSQETARNLVLWAAGADITPDFAGVDLDLAVAVLDEHRLDGRLLSRADETGIEIPAVLRDRLSTAWEAVKRRVVDQIDLLNGLELEFSQTAPGAGVLPVKGFTLYAHTGDPVHLRRSADVDVVGSDAAALANVISARDDDGSYHYHGEEHPYVFAHMRDFEVHMWYLVTGFPSGENPADYDMARTVGSAELVRSFSVSQLSYEDLAKTAVVVEVDGRKVRTPSLPMLLLIRCAHMYVGYAMNPRPLRYGTVRIEELCQAIDLIALDSFDHEVFWSEVEARDSWLVVDFMRRLAVDLLGRDPFGEAGPAIRHEWFPTNLWWDGIGSGFPVHLPWAPLELVVRSDRVPRLDDVLGHTTVDVVDGRGEVVVTDEPDAAAETYFFHRFNGGMGEARIVVETTDTHITVSTHVGATADDWMSMFGVETGDYRYEAFYKPADDITEFGNYSADRIPPGEMTYEGGRDGDQHSVSLVIPWAGVGRSAPLGDGETLSMVVRIRQQQRPWGAVSGGYVVPIRLATRTSGVRA